MAGSHPVRPDTLAGRVRERAALAALVDAAAAGQPGALIVYGEAGVGKTRLVGSVCDEAAATGVEILWGTCVLFGASTMPYAPVTHALKDWLAIPQRRLGPEALTAPSMLAAVDDALARSCEAAPTVLVIDDVQWADVASLDVLAYVLNGFRRQPLAVVVMAREENRPEGHPLHSWLANVHRIAGVTELEVGRLTRAETEAQMGLLIGTTPTDILVDEVYSRSTGNAYLTELLVRDLSADAEHLPPTPAPALRDAVLGRWHALSAEARDVTRLLAVGGRPVAFETLHAVAAESGHPAGPLAARLREALDAGVLADTGSDLYWFRHPLLAEVVLGTYAPGERAPVHAAYAAVLEAGPGPGRGELAADVAAHHEAAGSLDAAFVWSLRAADYAAALKAPVEESRQLGRACQLWDRVRAEVRGTARDHVTLLQRASTASHNAGDYAAARDLIGQALGLLDPAVEPLLVSRLLVDWTEFDWAASPGQYWYRPEMDEAIALTDPWPDSEERVMAMASRAGAQAWDGELGAGDELAPGGRPIPGFALAREALDAAERVDSDSARSAAGLAYTIAMLLSADEDIAQIGAEAYRLAARAADARKMARSGVWLMNRLMVEGSRLREAAELAERASREVGHAGGDGSFLAAMAADLLQELGQWERSQTLLRPILASDSRGISGAYARYVSARIAVHTGRIDDAQRHWERTTELVASDFTNLGIDEVVMQIMLSLGEPQRALDYLRSRWDDQARDLAELDFAYVWGATAAADLAERARDSHDASGVARAIAELDQLRAMRSALETDAFRTDLDSAWVHLKAARFAAEERRCRRDDGQAQAWAETRDLARAGGLRWEECYAHWRLAQSLTREGAAKPVLAEALRSGHEIAAALGAVPIRDDLESMARAAHVRLDTVPEAAQVADPTAGLAMLTEREREVLRHVVAGRTNTEIARSLFISDKTVSVHISNILRKTGTGSRVEAASWAARVGHQRGLHRPDERLGRGDDPGHGAKQRR
jgi:DNA-binding CsgD family transcriptional regulator/tetratricopeptide (TPR) repeat protein